MKKLIPCVLAVVLAGIMLAGCAEEKEKPVKDGKVPESIKASKKADEGG